VIVVMVVKKVVMIPLVVVDSYKPIFE